MATYAIYNESTRRVLTLYFGNIPPMLNPFVLISEADYNMAISNPENFKVVNNTLVPLDSQMYYLRIKRDSLLQESDRYMLSDYPIKNMTKEEWTERVLHYRQELREFPSTCNIHNPIFPIPPTEG